MLHSSLGSAHTNYHPRKGKRCLFQHTRLTQYSYSLLNQLISLILFVFRKDKGKGQQKRFHTPDKTRAAISAQLHSSEVSQIREHTGIKFMLGQM